MIFKIPQDRHRGARITRPSLLPLGWLTFAVTALLLAPLPVGSAMQRWPALMSEIENLGHPLAFGLLAHVGFRLLRAYWPAPARAPYLAVLVCAAAFGLATEVIQRLVGRDSSWIDLANDVLGAGFVLLLHGRREYRWRLLTAAVVVVALLATGPFIWTVAAYAYRSAQMPLLWRPDVALFQRFSFWQSGEYPGLVIDEPFPDWSGYRELVVELHNLRNVASPVSIRVHDRLHRSSYADRYNETFELSASESRIVRIPLEQIRGAPQGRQMDMAAIRGIIVFQTAANEPPHFRVQGIRLAH